MSSSGASRFKLTIKKTGSQQPSQQRSNGLSSAASGEQRVRASVQHSTPAIATAAANARPSPAGSLPRTGSLTLKGASRHGAQRPSTGTPGAPRIMMKGASSNSHATPSPAPPQQAAVAATPASAPGAAPRRLALKGSSSKPPAAAGAGTPATPAPAAAATPSAPRTAPPAVGGGAGGFVTPRPATVAPVPARAGSLTPSGSLSQPGKKLGIRLKGSSSTPAAGPARLASATPGSLLKPAATPASTPAGGATSASTGKPRITLNKSRGRQQSQQLSMHSQPSQQSLAAPYSSMDHMQTAGYKQEPSADAAKPQQAGQQGSQYGMDYYSSGGQSLHGYDSSHGAGYGSMPESGYMSHDYSNAAAASTGLDPAAAAAGGMYGSSTDYAAAAGMAAHSSGDPAAAAAGSAYGAGHDSSMYSMGMDPAAAAATAVVDYSAQAYYQPMAQQSGQKRGRGTGGARAAPAASPLGPRTKRPKPGQFRDDAEEDADEDFNPKAERARAMNRGGGGSGGGFATARAVKSKPAARTAAAFPGRAAGAARAGARAAAAQKAAHKAAQDAARRMHPHAAAPRAGAGHLAAVVPTHKTRHHMLPVNQAGAAGGAPRSPVLGEGDLMTGADAAAAFARSAAAADAVAVMDMDLEGGGAVAAVAAAPAPVPAPRAAGGGRGQQRAQQPRRTVEQVLAELHAQVEYVEETHPPTRETLNMVLAAVDKRDKYRFFVKPVTDEQAPGYSNIIRNPMDLSKMKEKVESGVYTSWNELMADIILMCANAKVYNHPNTKPHKEADVIFKYSVKYIKSFKQGKTNLRGAVAVAVRNANNEAAAASNAGAASGGAGNDANNAAAAGAAPSGPVTRATRRGRRPREEEAAPVTKRQRGTKFIAIQQNPSAADWSLTSTMEGDSARDTYKSRPKLYAANWGGLADGASPEGVGFGGFGKPILRCVAGHAANLPPDMYLGSLSRFVSGAGPVAEKLVMQILGRELAAKLVPIPGVTPTQLPQHAAAHAAHRQPHQLHPQHMAAAGAATQQPGLVRPAGVQPVSQAMQQPPQQHPQQQQQALAGLFGGALAGMGQGQNVLSQLTPAQMAQLHQSQLLQRQQQVQQPGQQFVPGPQHLAHAMGMTPMPARQV